MLWYQYQRRRLWELVEQISVVYKAMCILVQERVLKVVEERQLLAEEQGGFK